MRLRNGDRLPTNCYPKRYLYKGQMDSFGQPFSLHSTGYPYRLYTRYGVVKRLANTRRKLARPQTRAISLGYGRRGTPAQPLSRKDPAIQYYEASLCVRLLHIFLFLQNMNDIADSAPVHIVLSTNLFH